MSSGLAVRALTNWQTDRREHRNTGSLLLHRPLTRDVKILITCMYNHSCWGWRYCRFIIKNNDLANFKYTFLDTTGQFLKESKNYCCNAFEYIELALQISRCIIGHSWATPSHIVCWEAISQMTHRHSTLNLDSFGVMVSWHPLRLLSNLDSESALNFSLFQTCPDKEIFKYPIKCVSVFMYLGHLLLGGGSGNFDPHFQKNLNLPYCKVKKCQPPPFRCVL